MAFIKTLSTKNTAANLTLKSTKAAASPALAITVDRVADLDLITGSNVSAPSVSQKIVNGAGLQDIGRADQIIGSIDRGSASVMDQVGLQAPSVQTPGSLGGGALEALDPEAFIGRYDNRTDVAARASNADRNALTIGKKVYDMYEKVSDVNDKYEKAQTIFDGATDEMVCLGLEETTTVVGAIIGSAAPGPGTAIGGVVGAYVGAELCQASKGEASVASKAWSWVVSLFSTPNPEDDDAYGSIDISGKPDPLGVLEKIGEPVERLAKLNPNIDPLDEVQGQGIYTGPSLGAVSGSNGGTSTGSWTNPYGLGGYSGPSIDAFASSNGGSSTGTFDPLF
jgi:hypothetical protein